MYGRLIQGVDDSFGLKTTSAQITGYLHCNRPSKDSEASVIYRDNNTSGARSTTQEVNPERPIHIGPGRHLRGHLPAVHAAAL
jgi:hypothetical protein